MTANKMTLPASLTIENVVTFVALLRDAITDVGQTLLCDASDVELMTTPAAQVLLACHKNTALQFDNPSPAFTATLAALGMTSAFA
jgi:anti-anti-sigma regulatory factor